MKTRSRYQIFEKLYAKYHRREFVHPDPLEFLYSYDNPGDREIVALIASSLAYGRVRQILKSVGAVLDAMGPPRDFVTTASQRELGHTFRGFKHRFTTGDEVAALLHGVRRIVEEHGSLGECFVSGMRGGDSTVVGAISYFARELGTASRCRSLIPDPEKGSALKRLNLLLRWMVRRDDVDPGGWDGIPTSKLLVPVDTHMHSIALAFGLTERKNANLVTAIEITGQFARYAPDDPVRYDFALTRPGIRGEKIL